MAIFNNGYPASYQQMTIPQWQMQQQQMAQQQPIQPQVQQPVQPQQVMNSTIVWIKDRKEAEDYLIAPNNSVVFMDVAMTHLYMKSADQFGRPTFTSKLLTDEVSETPQDGQNETIVVNSDKYLTKEEFDEWVCDTLEKRLSELKQRNNRNRQNSKGGNDNA